MWFFIFLIIFLLIVWGFKSGKIASGHRVDLDSMTDKEKAHVEAKLKFGQAIGQFVLVSIFALISYNTLDADLHATSSLAVFITLYIDKLSSLGAAPAQGHADYILKTVYFAVFPILLISIPYFAYKAIKAYKESKAP